MIVQFGGQTPLKLAAGLEAAGVPLLGTSPEAIDLAEDRGRFGALLGRLGIKAPPYATARSGAEALAAAAGVGFPLLVRPSYVLGGRAMELAYDEAGLEDYLARVAPRGEIFLDRFLENAIEVDVDALCDGSEAWIGGIMQHVEEAGIHSGDSACVLPPHSLGGEMLAEIHAATREIALALGVVGLLNVQFGVLGDDLYVIEANPRASRTVPFVSKATGLPLAKLACRVMLGEPLAELGLPHEPTGDHVAVKEAVLPFDRFLGSDALLGPEMRSTGEVMGVARDFPAAFAKAQAAAGARLPQGGTVFLTVTDGDKPAAVGIASQLHDLGFRIVATRGTAAAISRMGIPCERLNKLGEGSPHVVDWIERGDVELVVNTPTGTAAQDRRLRDPPRGGRPRHPVHHDALGRDGRDARDRGGAARRPAGGGPAGPALRAGGRARVIEGAERTLAPLGRRLAEVTGHARHGAYDVLTCDDPGGPVPDAGAVLHARRRRALGRRGGRPPVPAARLLGPAPSPGRTARLPARGGRARHRAARASCARATGCGSSGRSGAASRRPGRAAADPRRRRRRDRAAGHLAGPPGRRRAGAAGLPRRRARGRGGAAARRPRGHRRRRRRPPRAGDRPARRRARLRPARHRLRLRAAGDARGGARAVRASRASRPSSRSRPGWRAATAAASAASCPRAAATCGCASTGRCSTRPSSSTSPTAGGH